MDIALRQLAVLILLGILLGVRVVAQKQAGGMTRDQSDGIELEGGRGVAIALRLFFLVGGVGGMVAWLVVPEYLPGNLDLPAWVHWLAIGLTGAGIVLLVAVHLALGVHFSGTLHLRDNHDLVQSGPYARIRHPMYTALLMIFLGFSLLIANVWIAVVLLASQAWILFWRLRLEEPGSRRVSSW